MSKRGREGGRGCIRTSGMKKRRDKICDDKRGQTEISINHTEHTEGLHLPSHPPAPFPEVVPPGQVFAWVYFPF